MSAPLLFLDNVLNDQVLVFGLYTSIVSKTDSSDSPPITYNKPSNVTTPIKMLFKFDIFTGVISNYYKSPPELFRHKCISAIKDQTPSLGLYASTLLRFTDPSIPPIAYITPSITPILTLSRHTDSSATGVHVSSKGS